MRSSVFFQPRAGWVGDVIPFQQDGTFWLFYLLDLREDPKPGTSWGLVTTRDFVSFQDRGVSLPHGDEGEPDFNAYTGSVVHDDAGEHHLFYTGQNPQHVGVDGHPVQLVMHATSSDGMSSWVKHPEDTFGASSGYESGDWRDPFVFRDDEPGGPWRMLVAARHESGPERRRGVIAQCISRDLCTWEPAEPFWDPRRYVTHECPDVFEWRGWWYLVYSEFSESFTTRYRMARTPDGPWSVPVHDTVDGRAYYASKTAARDGRRFFFGWIATREGAADDGRWQWAGTLSVLEARQNMDGTLAFSFPDELTRSFQDDLPVTTGLALPGTLAAPDGYATVLTRQSLPSQFYVRVVLDIAAQTTEAGLLLRASCDGDHSYVVRLEPKRNRLVLDRWPRATTGDMQWQVSGDVPFDVALERPCEVDPGEHTVEVVIDGNLCVVVVDRQVSLSTRLYGPPDGRLGVFVGEGCATVRDLRVLQRADQ